MPAKRLVSPRQLELLLEFMEQNPDIAKGIRKNDVSIEKTVFESKWFELTAKLNCIKTGVKKTAAKWRDYWNDKKYIVRKRARELRYTIDSPGYNRKLLDSMDHRILTILGNESMEIPAVSIPDINVRFKQPSSSLDADTSQKTETEPLLFLTSAEESHPHQTSVERKLPHMKSAKRKKREPADPEGSLSAQSSPTPPFVEEVYEQTPDWKQRLQKRKLALDARAVAALESIAVSQDALLKTVLDIRTEMAKIRAVALQQ